MHLGLGMARLDAHLKGIWAQALVPKYAQPSLGPHNSRRDRHRARLAARDPSSSTQLLSSHNGSRPPWSSRVIPANKRVLGSGCGYFHRAQKLPAKCWCGTALHVAKSKMPRWDRIHTVAEKPRKSQQQQQNQQPSEPAAAAPGPVDDSLTASGTQPTETSSWHSAEIIRVETIKDALLTQVTALVSQLEEQIANHKKSIIKARPIDHQVKAFEERLQQNRAKWRSRPDHHRCPPTQDWHCKGDSRKVSRAEATKRPAGAYHARTVAGATAGFSALHVVQPVANNGLSCHESFCTSSRKARTSENYHWQNASGYSSYYASTAKHSTCRTSSNSCGRGSSSMTALALLLFIVIVWTENTSAVT